jgi:hypothetical protein
MIGVIPVDGFERLVVVAIKGGVMDVLWGGEYVVWGDHRYTREEVQVVFLDLDNDPKFDPYQNIIHRENGETFAHYKATVQGLDEEQRLEMETETEYIESISE